MELCIDTSTRYASVALSEDGRVRAALHWRSDRNHSVELAPAIRQVMQYAPSGMDDLNAVCATRGPGGFSALRVGLSVAKSLAMARRLPLVSVNTLDVELLPFRNFPGPVSAVVAAGRSKVFLATLDGDSSGEVHYRIVERERLADALPDGTILCGEEARDAGRMVRADVTVVDAHPPTRSASALAELAYQRLRSGAADDPDTVQPIYMHSAQFEKAEQARRRRTQ